jgi:glutathione synthase/RimK-type ligase-like ATP-grasp enzyme
LGAFSVSYDLGRVALEGRIFLFGIRRGEFADDLRSAIHHCDPKIEVIEQNELTLSASVFSANFTDRDTIISRFVHRPPHGQHEAALVDFFEREEWANLVYGLAHTCGAGIFYNDPSRARIANSKQAQLAVAKAVGLKTPKTLITNNRKHAHDFIVNLAAPAVVKPIDCSVAPNPGKPDDTLLLFTREVSAGELAEANTELRSGSPAIFQERIEKLRELRVIMHGHEAVGIAIASQQHESSRLDWRRRQADVSMFSYEELSVAVMERLAAYLETFGLHSGVFDLAINTTNEVVFFECNPNGQWHTLDKPLGGRAMELTARSCTTFARARGDRIHAGFAIPS